MTIRIRQSRGLHARVAAMHKTPRIARTATLDSHGLTLEGQRFPYMIGTDVDVTTYGDRGFAMVTVGIFTDRFDIPRPSALPHTPPSHSPKSDDTDRRVKDAPQAAPLSTR